MSWLYQDRTFLVTGGAGFVGANIVRELLDRGCTVHLILKKETSLWRLQSVLDNARLVLHFGSLCDLEWLSQTIHSIKPEIVFHLAARGAYSTQSELLDIMNTNIVGTWQLFDVLSKVGCELVVNTGSSSEYGTKYQPMAETDQLDPNSVYAVTKAANTWLAHELGATNKLPVVSVRLFSVFGPYEEPSRFFPVLLASFQQKKVMKLVAPETARDFIYIDDVVEAFLSIEQLKKYPGYCFNIGTGRQSTIKEVVETAEEVVGKKLRKNWLAFTAKSWDSQTWVADMSQTHQLLNWRARDTVQSGLQKMWEWYQGHYAGSS